MRTFRTSSRLVVVAILASAALAWWAAPAPAASPSSATLDRSHPTVEWSGGPFAAPNLLGPTSCDPNVPAYCDTLQLTIGTLSSSRANVQITVTADNAGDVVGLTVWDSAGKRIAASEKASPTQSVLLDKPAPGAYQVRVEGIIWVDTGGLYAGRAETTKARLAPMLDDVGACSGTVTGLIADPTMYAVPGVTDDGRRVRLDVLVLLDGVDKAYAERFFADVKVPYADLGIDVVPTFKVDRKGFVGNNAPDLIAQARSRFPDGKVPAQYDLVEVLTSKDIQALGQQAIAGLADCMGGIAYRTRAFEVSEAFPPGYPDSGIPFGPVTLAAKVAAKITAHEMGHLLGGQHHQANCVEGTQQEDLHGDTSPCTLMFNSADFVSLHFSSVNGLAVRAFALKYATANDPA